MGKKLLSFSAWLMLLLFATSCSESRKADLLKGVPDDVDFVAVCDVETAIKSLGGSLAESKVKLPAFLLDQLPRKASDELDDFNALLRKSGIELDVCAVAGYYERSNPIVVFSLNDVNRFKNAIEDEGFKEKDVENGAVFYSKKVYESDDNEMWDDYGYIAIKDTYAYWIERVWVGSDFNAIRVLKRFIEDADKNPYAKTEFCKYITSGNLGGVSLKLPNELRQELRKAGVPNSIVELYEGVVCVKGDLDKNSAKMSVKLFDENGKETTTDDFNKLMDMNAKINPKALAYLDKDEFLVYAASIKNVDWDGYWDAIAEAGNMSRSDRATLNVVKSYLEKIDGTIALGFGLSNGLESISRVISEKDIMKEFVMTFVVETKEGKANSLINDLKGFLESQKVDFKDKSSGLSLNLPEEQGTLYFEVKDDIIVMSTRSIKESNNNEVVRNCNFAEYIAACAFALPKNNALMHDLDLNNDVKMVFAMDGSKLEYVAELEVSGDGSTGVVGNIVKMVLSVVKQQEKIEKKLNDTRGYNDYSYDDADTIAVDSVILDDDYDYE